MHTAHVICYGRGIQAWPDYLSHTVLSHCRPKYYRIAQNFTNFQFLTHDTVSRSDCNSIDGQHPGAKLLNLQGTLSKEIPSK